MMGMMETKKHLASSDRPLRLGNFDLLGGSKYIGVIDSTTYQFDAMLLLT